MAKVPRRAYFLATFTLVMLCLTLVQLLTVAAAHAPFMNLDFEIGVRNLPISWAVGAPGFDFGLDPVTRRYGAQSLRIASANALPLRNSLGTASQSFPVELVRGKRVHLSGWIKTENVREGAVGLWWRVDGPKGTLSLDNAPTRGSATGNSDWTRYEFERDVSPDASAIFWGVFFRGQGVAWFDGLEVLIDGLPVDEGPAPVIGEPTEIQLSWIRKQAIPVDAMAAGNGYEDLQPLKKLVGPARIVALGEASHGAHEFFRMKHRILEFLASEMKFTVFAIEANMPEAYRINQFVRTGEGDPKSLLKGMYFWTWNTQEVLDMILWMREFNQSGKGHVEFTGFDMQTPTVALQNVRDFVAANDYSDAVAEVDRAIRLSTASGSTLGVVNFSAAALAWKEVIEDIELSRDLYLSNGVESQEIEWAIQNAYVARESMQMRSNQVPRDTSMARNLEWIANQSPDAKIVVWAHNGHVARQPGAMGSFLAASYGKNYLPIEFAFHDGSYNAVGPKGLRAYEASPSFPGSAEYIFHETGMSSFILDLRKASSADPASAWIHGDIQYRNIGAIAADGFAPRTDLTKYSDAVIFFDHSSPSALLPF